jgi:argininosuccinate lyase
MIRKGRLGSQLDKDAANFISSFEFDMRIASYDIIGSMAHALMLHETGIISKEEARDILRGLTKILKEYKKLKFPPELEDIHVAVEEELTKHIGDIGGKLHTARSRNDQIACDLRLWVREEVNSICLEVIKLIKTLIDLAKEHQNTVMPGYTHLQHAQPTTLAHHLLSYCDAYLRDLERMNNSYRRINLNPLGAGALATTSFPIDRDKTAQLLGFDGLLENSMDAVSSRDFLLEILSNLSLLMINTSRLSEELILWSTHEFRFVEIEDKFASTSSIMPQKKNPDVIELIRAKSSRVIGNLISGLSLVKALPNSYNRDLQELSPLVADSLQIASSSLRLLGKILRTLKVDTDRMLQLCNESFIMSTELADFLVKEEGLSFRKAHQIVGMVVSQAIRAGISPQDIDRRFIEKIYGKPLNVSDEKLKEILSAQKAVDSKKVRGGPSQSEVSRMINSREKRIIEEEKKVKNRVKKIEDSKRLLFGKIEKITSENV